MKECEQQDKLEDQYDHSTTGPEKVPELSDGHMKILIEAP